MAKYSIKRRQSFSGFRVFSLFLLFKSPNDRLLVLEKFARVVRFHPTPPGNADGCERRELREKKFVRLSQQRTGQMNVGTPRMRLCAPPSVLRKEFVSC